MQIKFDQPFRTRAARAGVAILMVVVCLTACGPTYPPGSSPSPTPASIGPARLRTGSAAPLSTSPRTAALVMATTTPAVRLTVPPLTGEPPQPLGSMLFKNQWVQSVTLNATHIYWTIWKDESRIFRRPLAGGPTQVVASSHYSAGVVTSIAPLLSEQWLIWLDSPDAGITSWKLMATDLQTGKDKVVLEASADANSWPGPSAGIDGDWLAWTITLHSPEKNCDETVLGVMNLRTGVRRELDRVCSQFTHLWDNPSISGDYLVAEQDLPDSKGRGTDIYLFDLRSGVSTALTADHAGSMPQLSYPWVAWKVGPRFSFGPDNAVLHLDSKVKLAIRTPGKEYGDPRLSGHWLYWLPQPTKSLEVYDLQTQQMYLVAVPGQNQAIEAPIVYGDMIAWVRDLNFDHAPPKDSTVEWAHLSTNLPMATSSP